MIYAYIHVSETLTLQQQGAILRSKYHRKQQRKKFSKAHCRKLLTFCDTITFAPVPSQVLHNSQT
jgi:hypothetical protein